MFNCLYFCVFLYTRSRWISVSLKRLSGPTTDYSNSDQNTQTLKQVFHAILLNIIYILLYWNIIFVYFGGFRSTCFNSPATHFFVGTDGSRESNSGGFEGCNRGVGKQAQA